MFGFTIIIIALLSSIAVASQDLPHHQWGIAPVEDDPIILVFNETSNSSLRVEFQYNNAAAATLSNNDTFVETKLYQEDCVTPADASLASVVLLRDYYWTEDNVLSLDVDIVPETIIDTVQYYYDRNNKTSAAISFCVRVDYNYKDFDPSNNNNNNSTIIRSMNVHETIADISVDWTAEFRLANAALGTLVETGCAFGFNMVVLASVLVVDIMIACCAVYFCSCGGRGGGDARKSRRRRTIEDEEITTPLSSSASEEVSSQDIVLTADNSASYAV